MTKRVNLWALASLCLFFVANGASYFIRSDGYGMPWVQDGMIRVGCPFLMFETGGFSHREHVNLSAAVGNMLIAAVTIGVAIGFYRVTNRARGSDA